MNAPQTRSLHPMIWLATGAITVFSLTGIAVLTGLLPIPRQAIEPTPTASLSTASAPVTAASVPVPLAAASEPISASSAPLAAASNPAAAPEKLAQAEEQKTAPQAKISKSSKSSTAKRTGTSKTSQAKTHSSKASSDSAPLHPETATTEVPRICEQCGVIEQIRTVQAKGQGTGLGAVGGAVVGGVLGNQVGKGSGRTAARIGGAILGGLAGNEVEKRARSSEHYVITVRMEDGSSRTIEQKSAPQWSEGQKVRLNGDTISARTE